MKKSVLLGLVLALAASLAPVVAQSSATGSQRLPTSSPEPFTIAALAGGAFVGGALLSRRRKRDAE